MKHGQLIYSFSKNLKVIKDFVNVVEPFLEKDALSSIKKDAQHLAPLMVLFSDIDNVDFKLSKKERDLIVKKESLEIKDDSDGTKLLRINDPEKDKAFKKALARADLQHGKSKFLYETSLISLISSVESFFSQILHEHLNEYPDSIGDGKSFTFKELKEFSSIEDARIDLVSSKVENIIRSKFVDWIKYIEGIVGVDTSRIKNFSDDLIEAFLRRNLLVHNAGIVNNVYIKRMPASQKERYKYKKGDRVLVDKSYLIETISKLEIVFIDIASQIWTKTKDFKKQRHSYFECINADIVYEHLLEDDFFVSEHIAKILVENEKLTERDRLYARMNYWLSIKNQDRFEEIREEIESIDLTAKDDIFKLVRFALLDDKKNFYKFLPTVMEPNGRLGVEQFQEWPIFATVRRSRKKCKEAIEAAKEAIEAEEKEKLKSKSKKFPKAKAKAKRKPLSGKRPKKDTRKISKKKTA